LLQNTGIHYLPSNLAKSHAKSESVPRSAAANSQWLPGFEWLHTLKTAENHRHSLASSGRPVSLLMGSEDYLTESEVAEISLLQMGEELIHGVEPGRSVIQETSRSDPENEVEDAVCLSNC